MSLILPVDQITNQTTTIDKITILEATLIVMEIMITLEDLEIILEAIKTQNKVEATNLHMEIADLIMIEETATITMVVHQFQEDQDHQALVIT